MNIVLILLISINGITCMEDGMPIDSLPAYSNSIVTINKYNNGEEEDPCGGTIISPRHIVTTGFCVDGLRSDQIYVTARGTDPNVMMYVIVHKIHRYHHLRKIVNPQRPGQALWLNNIVILQGVKELTWTKMLSGCRNFVEVNFSISMLLIELPRGLNYEPMPLNYQTRNQNMFMECYTVGYNIVSPTMMIPQWSTAAIAPNSCVSPEISRLPHEIFAVSTTLATFTIVDGGISLICNGTAVGMIVDRVETPDIAAVLIYAFYQDFIEYIVSGGLAGIGESAVHVVVAIFESGEFLCGGFAVHNHYVVTVAHCVDGREEANLLVSFSHVENPRMNPASEWSSIESIELHPLYSSSYNRNLGDHELENDIAVLKLQSDLPWNPSIRLKDLPNPSHISADRPCEILRWTDPSSGDTESKILTRSYVFVHDRSNGFYDLEEEQFRADGFYYLSVASDDDIGNPIIFENNIIGMVIDVSENMIDSTQPVICLKIRPYEAFIREFMNRA